MGNWKVRLSWLDSTFTVIDPDTFCSHWPSGSSCSSWRARLLGGSSIFLFVLNKIVQYEFF
jgi:hypothetical protein